MMSATWQDPWTWREFLNVRRRMRTGSIMMAVAIVGAVPCLWIVLVPADPTLRPDLTTPWAWIGLAVCAVLAYATHTSVGRARARFDQALYGVTQRTRDTAAARGFPLETDLGEVFPPILISRQHRMLGVVGPTPLLISMNEAEVVVSDGADNDDPETLKQPHVALRLKGEGPRQVFIIAGRGLGRPNMEQTVVLGERLKDFFAPGFNWGEAKPANTIDVAVFIESMRVKK